MHQLISKEDQLSATLFGGNFLTNKPVAQGNKAVVKPYANLFYWSHGRTVSPVEFGLHPHDGFEIITFIWAGTNTHYDTTSQKWTPLGAGQFQVIKSGSGLQHAEKISTRARSFQIWFDPNFEKSLPKTPSYKDYNSADWPTVVEDGLSVQYYVGGNSPASVDTESIIIKTYSSAQDQSQSIALNAHCTYHFYVLNGKAQVDGVWAGEDDSVKISDQSSLAITIQGGSLLFVIQTPTQPTYKTVFN